jgi:hypothetical protein
MGVGLTGNLFVEEMSCFDCCGLNSVEQLFHPPMGFEHMPHTSVALTAHAGMMQYLNVRQRKLGTIIIQTVDIPQH